MSEEEKKAIEELKKARWNSLAIVVKNENGKMDISYFTEKHKKTILNLIDKQQKEIKNLAKRQNDLIDEYENELLEKNNYIFQLENEREALHKLIDEEM